MRSISPFAPRTSTPLRGYFNGPSVFLCPEGRADAPCEVEIAAPEGAAYRNWRVATTLPRAGAAPWGFGCYRAANYDELIDHPVEMADFSLASFEAGGATHDIAVTGRIHADLDRLAADLARICQWQVDFFGDGPGVPRAVRPVSVPGGRRRRRLRRTRASHEHEPLLQAGRIAGTRRRADLGRLSSLPRAREPRVLPQLEREADQAGRVRALRPLARELHAPALGVRRHHVLLRRPRAGAKRRHRSAKLPGTRRTDHHHRAARSGSARPERRRLELRCVDQVLPARREHSQRRRQLLRQGRARRARARSHAAPIAGRRSTH